MPESYTECGDFGGHREPRSGYAAAPPRWRAGSSPGGANRDVMLHDYSLLDRFVHRIALGTPYVRRLSFDLDGMLTKIDAASAHAAQPVYVTGLARSGTTMLLNALHRSARFASLTYRDMPFVLAPNLAQRLMRVSRREGAAKQRAHGDRLEVDFDSPEAFEEVFWLTFCGGDYIERDRLLPHTVQATVLDDYCTYVARIVASRGGGERYLAKNNNNVLRIEALKQAFPRSVVLVPFREPAAHVASLRRQHERFLQWHAEDRFARTYMGWLGHHEFGADFRPFAVPGAAPPRDPEALRAPDYWLDYWAKVYRYILDRHGQTVSLIDFDQLCREPDEVLSRVSERIFGVPDLFDAYAREVDAGAASQQRSPGTLPPLVEETYQCLIEYAL